MEESYYQREECSNSDLSELWKQFLPPQRIIDLEYAYKMGTLIDVMITEPNKLNLYSYKIGEVQYSRDEFMLAKAMKESFMKDDLCRTLKEQSVGQAVYTKELEINYEGFIFTLKTRCKYDLFSDVLGWGADIKSTVATTAKAFNEQIMYCDYDRSRAFYMDISGAEKDIIIGISKIAPHKLFKVLITRDSELYKEGKKKYEELCFKYYTIML